ncbi:DUF3592 domain-containing protein [Streptacidiphilus sp. PB12-B1b]|uniref:DUF3592 domain-containing protein n=1 Tax=Streptacidiphilus sp. PB12-B1b TaxID=2705012 RepID=UPI0015F928EC|nr:DUF3592 domain-containing protein [Streptacidiphilus sp. PB12-B1b]QMU74685.1 DUF3592 domain-containing protein [Streptacidiphilus sp. PB12-B1b]
MGTPLGLFTGAFFTLFGLGVLTWCVTEVRTRIVLRGSGTPATARVVAGPGPALDHADTSPLLAFHVEGRGEIVARPRGWTTIRRTPALAVDALVPVSYDPARPERVAVHGVRQARSDVFWLLLGAAFTVCGVLLLVAAV